MAQMSPHEVDPFPHSSPMNDVLSDLIEMIRFKKAYQARQLVAANESYLNSIILCTFYFKSFYSITF